MDRVRTTYYMQTANKKFVDAQAKKSFRNNSSAAIDDILTKVRKGQMVEKEGVK